MSQIPCINQDTARKLRGKGIRSILDLCSLTNTDVINLLNRVIERGKRGQTKGHTAISFLNTIPLISAENVSVEFEVEKSTGKSKGIATCDLVITKRQHGKGHSGASKLSHTYKGARSNGAEDSLTKFTVVLGTLNGRFLLAHKSFSVNEFRDSFYRKPLQLKFDWVLANANGGTDGGSMVMRVLLENIRGIDCEIVIPLR